ncbi:MAG: AMP-binding protein, partial [Pseudomonadales bacterium]|nr:AMP-binding protein [Pseudomonadales bacterium]
MASSDGAQLCITHVLSARTSTDPTRTVFTFLQDESEYRLTYGQLHGRALRVAWLLQQHCRPGDRALLLFPPGLSFIEAFFGCLYAGVIAVPVYPPRPREKTNRLEAITRDCDPRLILTVADVLPLDLSVPAFAVDDLAGSKIKPFSPEPATPAFLQYTSGSTGDPKGVIITHANLNANADWIDTTPGGTMVSWLPAFHDMGLIFGILQPIRRDRRCYFMAPTAFLQKPVRWLQALSRYRATHTAAPDFAYALCARRFDPERDGPLDLSALHTAYNGAEPVRPETIRMFTST